MKKRIVSVILLACLLLGLSLSLAKADSPSVLELGPEQLILKAVKDSEGRGGIDKVSAATNTNTNEVLLASEEIVSLATLGYLDYEWFGTTLVRLNILDQEGRVQRSSALLGVAPNEEKVYPQYSGVKIIYDPFSNEYYMVFSGTLVDLETGEAPPLKIYLTRISSTGEIIETVSIPDYASEGLQDESSVAVDKESGRILVVWVELYQGVKKELHLEVLAQIYERTDDDLLRPTGELKRVFGERNFMQAPQAFWVNGQPYVLAHYPYFDGKDAAADILLKNLDTSQIVQVNNRVSEEKYDVEGGLAVVTSDGQIAIIYARSEGKLFTLPDEIVLQTVSADLSPTSVSEPVVLVQEWGVLFPQLALLGDYLLFAYLQLKPWEYCPILWCGTRQEGRIGLYNPYTKVLFGETLPLSEKENSLGPINLVVDTEEKGRAFWVYYFYGIGARDFSLTYKPEE